MTASSSRIALSVLIVFFLSAAAWAGGPLVVGGPAVGTRNRFGVDGKPFTWDPAKMPIAYRVDPGPMAVESIRYSRYRSQRGSAASAEYVWHLAGGIHREYLLHQRWCVAAGWKLFRGRC